MKYKIWSTKETTLKKFLPLTSLIEYFILSRPYVYQKLNLEAAGVVVYSIY